MTKPLSRSVFIALLYQSPKGKYETALVLNPESMPAPGIQKPSKWGMIGGRARKGEKPLETAQREGREEATVELDPSVFQAAHREAGTNDHEVIIFLAIVYERLKLRAGDDILDAQWFPIEELPPNMYQSHFKRFALFEDRL
ncbi:MAG: hypothetical protein A2806_04410 [Candidatus Terrybacteria bacterium RIFCSPHIGHO2_01_FULL_48_17]|uniref:Nudix hydrolase domain-containing protein n=1 Tax=Candidatus Terrybacteria bacterium RIFCSPHIGHO2_01_FULL_48_17 TaxID=1802362 RepID=A0A1G2PKR2_9BACT|nr:MAG: hypothetical protein A2806_04410 [Candidatus Terrybacteria bacterium RIFCSPHIGHO2_01_FULL_48_17]OHA52857.1 MAG: hypothetical protein A3A30_03105 [Candidatus Terrybacteria bacterium RIFCSPLOWO2_01_FULL_48_14]